ncbi:MAG: hypothetical protein WC784_03080 [Candidatus Shapirobacteria bacterium]|jgi:hypothetical protein
MPRGRKKNRILPTLKLKPDTTKSIFFIFFLILAMLSVFSFLQRGTMATDFNLTLTKYFGFGSVMVPFLLLLISFLFAKIKSPLREANVFFGFFIMFFSLLSLLKQGIVGLFIWEQFLALFSEAPLFSFYFSP